MRILQAETTQGTVTPTTIADSILNITGVDMFPQPASHLASPLASPFSVPALCVCVQVTSSTWPARTYRAHSLQNWGLSRPH